MDEIDKMFINTRLNDAWLEYRKTLHIEYVSTGVANDFGFSKKSRYRATVLAENYFTDAGIVDLSVNADFFRHAPGIFTGFGIIGTFIGLIYGLGHFSISDDPHGSQDQLRDLIHSVSGAFHASAWAIIIAIGTTCFEKFYMNLLYARLSVVRDAVDSLFKVGVGEEYLQALKQSSEMSQTQMLQVKDKLMEELKPFLEALAEEQFKRSNEIMPRAFSDALKENLGEPLKQIASSVQNVGSDQNDHVKSLLTDVLFAFSEKMQEIFGQQFTDILKQTTEAMERVACDFSSLADRMGEQGNQVVSSMGNQLTQVIDQMEARQREMGRAMEQFVLELRTSVGESNTQSQLQIQAMIAALQEQVRAVLERVSQTSQQALVDQGALQHQLQEQSVAMQDMFSQKFTDMLVKTTEAMERVSRDFSGIADRMGAQGDQVVSSMGNQLMQVVDQMDTRQHEMGRVMEQSVLELRTSVSESNTQSQLQIQRMITDLQEQVGDVLERVSQSSQQAFSKQGSLQEQLQDQSKNALQTLQFHMDEAITRVLQFTQNAMDDQTVAQAAWQQKAVTLLEGLVEQVQASVAATNQMTQAVQEAISQLIGVTTSTTRSLEVSTGNLRIGIDTLNTSAGNITSAMREGERFAQQLERVATQFDSSLETTREIITNYQEARLQFAESMKSLGDVVENARREASMTQQQLETIERASRILNEAQTKASDYVAQVSKVLVDTHKVFVDEMQNTIGDVSATFFQSLNLAVNKVSGAVVELSDALDKIDHRRIGG